MSEQKLGVCPKCGNSDKSKFDYNNGPDHYAGGNSDDKGRTGYAVTCTACGTQMVEFWKFDEYVTVEEPLPQWAEQDRWVWRTCEGKFAQITDIAGSDVWVKFVGDTQPVRVRSDVFLSYCTEARVRPLTRSEMLHTIGKIVCFADDPANRRIVDGTAKVDGDLKVSVAGCVRYYTSSEFMLLFKWEDGTPCGVLERKACNGDWVKS